MTRQALQKMVCEWQSGEDRLPLVVAYGHCGMGNDGARMSHKPRNLY
jgi:hypothetical protein